MRLARRAAAAAVLPIAGIFAVVPARIYPNLRCLVTTVPLYSPAMWKAAQGKEPEANVGVANWGSNTQNGAAGGPGKARNHARAAQIKAARADGTRILGYIATSYGTGAAGYTTSSVEAQMTDWRAWYGITAFVLDQVPTATSRQPYYAALKAWARKHISRSAQQWLNMGAYPAASSWMSDATTIMDWEDNIPPAKPPSWVHRYPANRFAMIMNAVPGTARAIAAAVSDLEQAHAQAGFITSDASYQTLPNWSYWSTFAADAAGRGCSSPDQAFPPVDPAHSLGADQRPAVVRAPPGRLSPPWPATPARSAPQLRLPRFPYESSAPGSSAVPGICAG